MRPCVELVIPPGPDGVDVLMGPLDRALAGTGPAVALVPGGGSAGYRARIRAAVQPGEPVPDEVVVVVSTSGSTGDPAGVLLPGAALRAAAARFAERSGQRQHLWVAALPLHHTGGLMVAVRATLAGTVPVGVAGLGGAAPYEPADFVRATRLAEDLAATPLAVSLVPAQLAALARDPDAIAALRLYDAVLVGGAGTPPALTARLGSSGIRLTLSYGMSETCGGAVFDGRPLPGMSVRVEADGRLRLAGDQVAAGYRAGRHPDRWGLDDAGRRWFLTEDLGTVGTDGEVTVLGRSDDVVQVGGASVSLAAVANVLRADPRVAAAEVVALPDERVGSRLVALVVPGARACSVPGPEADAARAGHGSGRALADQLADAVAEQMGRAGRPRRIRLVPRIPLLESGKADLRALAELAERADELRHG